MISASLTADSSLSNPVLLHNSYIVGHSSIFYRYQDTSSDWVLFLNRYDFATDTLHWQVKLDPTAKAENIHTSVFASSTFVLCGQTED